MCLNCDWEVFIEDCDTVLEEVDTLPERANDFAESVRTKIEGMKEWALQQEHATQNMESALANMRDGIKRWQK